MLDKPNPNSNPSSNPNSNPDPSPDIDSNNINIKSLNNIVSTSSKKENSSGVLTSRTALNVPIGIRGVDVDGGQPAQLLQHILVSVLGLGLGLG
jgi:hypothetical protein